MIEPNELFEWDAGNTKHVILDYPKRGNTKAEIESIFTSPHFESEFNRKDPKTGELRYYTLGVGTQGVVKYVVFVVRNNKIRPITCFVANPKQRRKYYERVSQSESGKDDREHRAGGSSPEFAVPSGS